MGSQGVGVKVGPQGRTRVLVVAAKGDDVVLSQVDLRCRLGCTRTQNRHQGNMYRGHGQRQDLYAHDSGAVVLRLGGLLRAS